MESYKIIRNPKAQEIHYDFTFKNGVSFQASFSSSTEPSQGELSYLEVLDGEKNDITAHVIALYRQRKTVSTSGKPSAPLKPSPRALDQLIGSHEVNRLINFCKRIDPSLYGA
jgi:hypothetical protein